MALLTLVWGVGPVSRRVELAGDDALRDVGWKLLTDEGEVHRQVLILERVQRHHALQREAGGKGCYQKRQENDEEVTSVCLPTFFSMS